MGKTVEEATATVGSEEIFYSGERVRKVRPVKVDGEAMMVTMDYRTDRINVETENGKIVKIVGAN